MAYVCSEKRAACVLIVFLHVDSFTQCEHKFKWKRKNRVQDIWELKLEEYLGVVTHESYFFYGVVLNLVQNLLMQFEGN